MYDKGQAQTEPQKFPGTENQTWKLRSQTWNSDFKEFLPLCVLAHFIKQKGPPVLGKSLFAKICCKYIGLPRTYITSTPVWYVLKSEE